LMTFLRARNGVDREKTDGVGQDLLWVCVHVGGVDCVRRSRPSPV
jgi:hypothetical protein